MKKTYAFSISYYEERDTFIVKGENQQLAFETLKKSKYKDTDVKDNNVNVFAGITVENTDISDWNITDITDQECIGF